MSAELATAATTAALLAPYLAEAGKGAAEVVGKQTVEGAGKVLAWLRDRLTGRSREALDDLAADPASDDNQADLRKQLAKWLEANPTQAAELRALLPATAQVETVTQSQTVGSGIGAQTAGQQNNVTIHKG